MNLSLDQLAEFQDFSEQLADVAADAIKPYFRNNPEVENKGKIQFDPVTIADKVAETAMRQLIRGRYPKHGILGEEGAPDAGTSGLTWVLDPIDGTAAFISGLPLWGTLIALNDGQRPVLGVMNQPFTGERYVATPFGAWCNHVPLKTRTCGTLSSATLMCTTPAMFDTAQRRAAFEAVATTVRLLQFGGDCYAYCMLASGFVDLVVEAGLEAYDIQALIPIVEGAGGVITDWRGASAQNGGTVAACGDPQMHADLLDLLRFAA